MNWSEELRRVLKKYWWLFLFLVLGIPLIINVLFKWHSGISFLEGEWQPDAVLGFYGSLLGGSIGGLGTLAAVMITTSETRDIQRKNEEQLEVDREEKRKKERKEFIDDVVEDIAKFCTDSSMFKESREKVFQYNNDLKMLNIKLEDTWKNLEKAYAIQKFQSNPHSDAEVERLKIEEGKLKQTITNTRRNAEALFSSRRIAQERFLVLRIKLSSIEGAEEIIRKMRHLMVIAMDDSISFEEYSLENDELIAMTYEFGEEYKNG